MELIVTATGGLCLLIGVLLIGKIVGSYDLALVLASADLIQSSEFYLPGPILILLGAFTKSAQFPFHFWLAQATAPPTPGSDRSGVVQGTTVALCVARGGRRRITKTGTRESMQRYNRKQFI